MAAQWTAPVKASDLKPILTEMNVPTRASSGSATGNKPVNVENLKAFYNAMTNAIESVGATGTGSVSLSGNSDSGRLALTKNTSKNVNVGANEITINNAGTFSVTVDWQVYAGVQSNFWNATTSLTMTIKGNGIALGTASTGGGTSGSKSGTYSQEIAFTKGQKINWTASLSGSTTYISRFGGASVTFTIKRIK